MSDQDEKITKERDDSNLSEEEEISRNVNSLQGLDGTRMFEKSPTYDKSPIEKVISIPEDAHIIMGKEATALTNAYNRSGQIRLIAGLGATNSSKLKKFAPISANATHDAATVLISQRINIDKEWSIPKGAVGKSGKRSAVGLKADNIRIEAREGIKIRALSPNTEKNSLFGKVETVRGIDLMAGISVEGTFKTAVGNPEGYTSNKGKKFNYLQPIVKGDNLVAFLRCLVKEIQDLAEDIKNAQGVQMEFNTSVRNHTHITPTGPDSPSSVTMMSAPKANQKLGKYKYKKGKFKDNLEHLKDIYLGDGDRETEIRSKSVRST